MLKKVTGTVWSKEIFFAEGWLAVGVGYHRSHYTTESADCWLPLTEQDLRGVFVCTSIHVLMNLNTFIKLGYENVLLHLYGASVRHCSFLTDRLFLLWHVNDVVEKVCVGVCLHVFVCFRACVVRFRWIIRLSWFLTVSVRPLSISQIDFPATFLFTNDRVPQGT